MNIVLFMAIGLWVGFALLCWNAYAKRNSGWEEKSGSQLIAALTFIGAWIVTGFGLFQ